MKNKVGDPVMCGKLIKTSPVTIEINIVDGLDIEDNILALNDMGYAEHCQISIDRKENFQIEFPDYKDEQFLIDTILNYDVCFEKLQDHNTVQNHQFLKIRSEFMGVFVDARNN